MGDWIGLDPSGTGRGLPGAGGRDHGLRAATRRTTPWSSTWKSVSLDANVRMRAAIRTTRQDVLLRRVGILRPFSWEAAAGRAAGRTPRRARSPVRGRDAGFSWDKIASPAEPDEGVWAAWTGTGGSSWVRWSHAGPDSLERLTDVDTSTVPPTNSRATVYRPRRASKQGSRGRWRGGSGTSLSGPDPGDRETRRHLSGWTTIGCPDVADANATTGVWAPLQLSKAATGAFQIHGISGARTVLPVHGDGGIPTPSDTAT